jgi:phospho-N-acetylmuramoyl-pentapeptide-transferase
MLYHLLYPLSHDISYFNLFRYITFRSAGAAITALIISLILGPWLIRLLRKHQVKEEIRIEGPQSHYAKAGTPTMGGLIILAAIIIPTLLWADLSNRFTLYMLLVTVWLGAIGFMDDFLKAVKHQKKGLVARKKLIGQIALGLLLGVILYLYPPTPNFDLKTDLPFFKNYYLDFPVYLFVPFVIMVIAGASNAVNLTDGLDGLAIGLSMICLVAFAGMAYITGRFDFTNYLDIVYLPGAGELTVFCSAAIGASLGFLWYNTHPAEVFMGDTGALALGGILGALSILLKKELLLVIVGGVFVVEAVSVILQVSVFKLRGKRIFKMAPLHHHFELSGWHESKVVVRFWIVGVLLALLTLSTFKIR